MTPPAISLCHATFGRPEKAVLAWRSWMERAALPGKIEYIFAQNDDDPTAETTEARVLAGFSSNAENVGRPCPRFVTGPFKGSAGAWNEAARVSTGWLMVQVSDDFVPPHGWDMALYAALDAARPMTWESEPVVVAVSDGFRKDSLLCMAICTRKYYELDGYFLMPAFRSVFSDDLFTFKAIKRRNAGTIHWVDARHLVFKHEHHYHMPDVVPMDPTYQRQNSPEAYEHGERLFDALCPNWRESGIVDWRT